MAPINVAKLSHIGFLVLPHFSMIALVNALEPLRLANYLSGRELYRWSIIDPSDSGTAASNGLTLAPDCRPANVPGCDIVFVCGGLRIQEAVTPQVVSLLREWALNKQPLGSLCTGTYALAKARLLDGYRCAISWENLPAIREDFPHTEFTQELFVIDRGLVTCAGGTAPIDLMLNLIHARHGRRLAAEVSEQFNVDRIRDERDQQPVPLLVQVGPAHEAMLQAAALMEAHVESPISMEALADEVGLSLRQLERLFRRYMETTPAHHYLGLRLRRARNLLQQTPMSVTEITVACGFQSSSHLCKSYRTLFGHPPSWERRPDHSGNSRPAGTPLDAAAALSGLGQGLPGRGTRTRQMRCENDRADASALT